MYTPVMRSPLSTPIYIYIYIYIYVYMYICIGVESGDVMTGEESGDLTTGVDEIVCALAMAPG